MNKKLLLVILDGVGVAPKTKYNAVQSAHTPYLNSLFKNYSSTILGAAEGHVGLPQGFMGNSEVGHLHIGAGKVVPQHMVKINQAIKDKTFFGNEGLLNALDAPVIHVIGLLSDGGVHSHIDHLLAVLQCAKQQKVSSLNLHLFLDGRDMAPRSAMPLIKKIQKKLLKTWSIATISGRYYAMDRDKRWNRTKKAYDAMVCGKGIRALTPAQALADAYKRGERDEFVMPTIIGDYRGMDDHESVININFRADRAKQITHAFVDRKFLFFSRVRKNIQYTSMAPYDEKLRHSVIFPDPHIQNTLGEVIAKQGLKQLRVAETEKWAHVTFFFNGLTHKPFRKESRRLIPSPKVATYDSTPAMSAPKITNYVLENMHRYDCVIVNYANGDMVGHTGDFNATVKAMETIDRSLARLIPAALEKRYAVVITADHGNAENMQGKWQTSHTLSKVPCIVIPASEKHQKIQNIKLRKGCGLAQVAPTVLELMNIKPPKEMERSLIVGGLSKPV